MEIEDFLDMFTKCCEKGYIEIQLKKEPVSRGTNVVSEIFPSIRIKDRNGKHKRIDFTNGSINIVE